MIMMSDYHNIIKAVRLAPRHLTDRQRWTSAPTVWVKTSPTLQPLRTKLGYNKINSTVLLFVYFIIQMYLNT